MDEVRVSESLKDVAIADTLFNCGKAVIIKATENIIMESVWNLRYATHADAN